MKKIILSPYSKRMRNGADNPKNYHYWRDVVIQLLSDGIETIQIGVDGEPQIHGVRDFKSNMKFDRMKDFLMGCDTWVSGDNFFHHFAAFYEKPGVVVFGTSDPEIFGYQQNINILKDRKYIRARQFNWWEEETHSDKVFVNPEVVVEKIKSLL